MRPAEIGLPIARSDADRDRLESELACLEEDLADEDLLSARVRLFSLFSSLLIDLSGVAEPGDNGEFQQALRHIRSERQPYQQAACAALRRYQEHRTAQLKRELTQARRRAGNHLPDCLDSQQREIKEALFTTQPEERVLAVRHLLSRITDPEARRELREARTILEAHRRALDRERERYKSRTARQKEELADRETLTRDNRDLTSRLRQTTGDLRYEQGRRYDAEQELSAVRRREQRLQERLDRQYTDMDDLQRQQEEQAEKLAAVENTPAWERQIEEEDRINRRYAERIDAILNDKRLHPDLREQAAANLEQLWHTAITELCGREQP